MKINKPLQENWVSPSIGPCGHWPLTARLRASPHSPSPNFSLALAGSPQQLLSCSPRTGSQWSWGSPIPLCLQSHSFSPPQPYWQVHIDGPLPPVPAEHARSSPDLEPCPGCQSVGITSCFPVRLCLAHPPEVTDSPSLPSSCWLALAAGSASSITKLPLPG